MCLQVTYVCTKYGFNTGSFIKTALLDIHVCSGTCSIIDSVRRVILSTVERLCSLRSKRVLADSIYGPPVSVLSREVISDVSIFSVLFNRKHAPYDLNYRFPSQS